MEQTLEFLLSFDGRIHWLEEGYWLKFEIKRVEATEMRPHGLRYSFTLHDPEGTRLVGFDNAHSVAPRGSRLGKRPSQADHWHRTEADEGRPYIFKDADTLLADFFQEIRRVLAERGLTDTVLGVGERKDHDRVQDSRPARP